jgi:hypothetical protein
MAYFIFGYFSMKLGLRVQIPQKHCFPVTVMEPLVGPHFLSEENLYSYTKEFLDEPPNSTEENRVRVGGESSNLSSL